MNFELRPQEGIGDVYFGMTPSEVHQRISEPHVYEQWMGGNLNDSLLYHGMIFGFDRCDSRGPLPDARLVEVSINMRADVTFGHRPLFEWHREEVAEHLAAHLAVFQRDPDGGITAPYLGLWFKFHASGTVKEAGIYRTVSEAGVGY
jgi:hypothetical protein